MAQSPLSLDSTVRVRGGTDVPVLGLGLSHNGGYSEEAVVAALHHGYRLLDTATRYGTEACIPKALAASGVDPRSVLVTTKLWPGDASDPMSAIKRSLRNLEREAVDVYLVHWPDVQAAGLRGKHAREHVWNDMIRIQEAGLTRSIGVSNYQVNHLEEMLDYTSDATLPCLNQIELNPWQHPRDIMSLCRDHSIAVQGYSPLAKGTMLNDATLTSIARRYKATAAQLLIRWSLQKGALCIPKSTSPARVVQNADVFRFSISDEHLKEMDTWHSNLRVTWDPSGVP